MSEAKQSILEEIVARRRLAVAAARRIKPLAEMTQAAESRHEWRDFAAAISGEGLKIIAELKQASPSRGVLRQDYRVRELGQGYEAGGAAALSVLTEERYFQGSLTDLIDARDATGLPVLRKDFIVEEYQVYESAAAGADAFLLIVAALKDSELRALIELGGRLRLSVLVEAHTEEELNRAVQAGARIIGVNNRDLKTMRVSLDTSLRLRERIPTDCLGVSESGVQTPEDLRRVAQAGYDAALIGESLMTADDPGRALAELLRGAQVLGPAIR